MVEVMRQCYWQAVEHAEKERGGTTFTAGLLQLDSMIFASLQALPIALYHFPMKTHMHRDAETFSFHCI